MIVEGVAARRPVGESLILEEALVPPVEQNVPDRHDYDLYRLHGNQPAEPHSFLLEQLVSLIDAVLASARATYNRLQDAYEDKE